MRARVVWWVFGVATAAAAAAMSWITATGLELERAEARSRGRWALEEDARLALWRMDSRLTPLLARESSRSPLAYHSFYYPADPVYNRMLARIERDELLVPSPLIRRVSPLILVHFELSPTGAFTSPQVPTGNERDLAESGYVSPEEIERAGAELDAVRELVSRQELLERLRRAKAVEKGLPDAPAREPELPSAARAAAGQSMAAGGEAAAQSDGSIPGRGQLRSSIEWLARSKSYQQAAEAQNAEVSVLAAPPEPSEEEMTPVWKEGSLLIVRRVEVSGTTEANGAKSSPTATVIQGFRVDWPRLRDDLLASVGDLLPHARLEIAGGEARSREYRLAALPLRLDPGREADLSIAPLSPIRVALLTAWGCGLLAALAVAALLRGVLALSERRRVFVSAVTHELRTPLTTFRMYTEMLAGGMVRGEAKQSEYLGRLSVEAERLDHLVENVLAYARIESGRVRAARESSELGPWLDRVSERLRQRCERSGRQLVVEASDAARRARVRLDLSALEQVAVNLVDNALKYARPAEREEIRLELELPRPGGPARLRVRDFGPGLSRHDRRRLFRPFSKSDREAAASAPGVGLGLALSRRLARAIGGELRVDDAGGPGTAFVVEVPVEIPERPPSAP